MLNTPVRCAHFGCGELTDSPDERGLCASCAVKPACLRCGMPNSLAERSALCAACVWEDRDPKAAERRARKALMAELGMPPDAICKRINHNGSWAGDDWRDYSIELFGMSVGNMPEPCPWPFWRLSVPGGTGAIVVQLWQRRVRWTDCPAYIEARWHPEHGETIQLIGLEKISRFADAQKVVKGLELLRAFDQRRGGGRSGLTSEQDQSLFEEIVKEFAKLECLLNEDNEGRRGKSVSIAEVADGLYCGKTKITDCLARCSLTPDGDKIVWRQVWKAARDYAISGEIPRIFRRDS